MQTRNPSQENETKCVFPQALPFLLIPMFRRTETDQPGCVALESEFTQRSLGEQLWFCTEWIHSEKGDQRQHISIKTHILCFATGHRDHMHSWRFQFNCIILELNTLVILKFHGVVPPCKETL